MEGIQTKTKDMKLLKKIIKFFKQTSPCCNTTMTSVFDMELDKLRYSCDKCKKEWI